LGEGGFRSRFGDRAMGRRRFFEACDFIIFFEVPLLVEFQFAYGIGLETLFYHTATENDPLRNMSRAGLRFATQKSELRAISEL
jgi:hypothetical protein